MLSQEFPTRWAALSTALVIMGLWSVPSQAQSGTPAIHPCFSQSVDRPADLDKRIAACLELIGDSELSPPIRARAYGRRAEAYVQKGDASQLKRAAADLAEAMRLVTDIPQLQAQFLYLRGGVYLALSDNERALDDFSALIRLQPSTSAYMARATVSAVKGDHKSAIADFDEVIRLDPKFWRAYTQRALSYLKIQNLQQGLSDANQALALNSNDAVSYSTRSLIYLNLGRPNDAISDLRRAASLDRSSPELKDLVQKAERAQSAARKAAENVKSANQTSKSLTAPAIIADPSTARRDYELTAQIGNREAWEAFLKQYQTGFYADLARAQLAKLTGAPDTAQADRDRAEKERIAREKAEKVEKERLAREQAERERLEKERAAREQAERERIEKERFAREAAERERQRLEKERLAKEEADRQRLEKERLAREAAERQRLEKERLAKEESERQRLEKERLAREQAERERAEKERLVREQVENERRAKEEAERQRLEKERLAREAAERQRLEKERLAKEEAERQRLEKERLAREQAERDKKAAEAAEKLKMAVLPPPKDAAGPAQPAAALAGAALVTEIKKELMRLGCYSGPVDEQWKTAQTGASVKKFIRLAHLSNAPDEPSMDFLNALRGKSARICPIECGKREMESDGKCIAKTCAMGYSLDEDGDCVRQKGEKQRSAERTPETAPNRQPHETAPSGGGRCGARSCSAAFNGCLRHCAENGGRRCHHCNEQYGVCMQTGTFTGRVCQLSGLARN